MHATSPILSVKTSPTVAQRMGVQAQHFAGDVSKSASEHSHTITHAECTAALKRAVNAMQQSWAEYETTFKPEAMTRAKRHADQASSLFLLRRRIANQGATQ